MSISALGSGLAGMRSFQRALDSSANNIANSQTPNYQAERISFQAGSDGGVSATDLTPGTNGANGAAPDLANDIVDQIKYKASYQASAKVVQTASDVLGTLINITA